MNLYKVIVSTYYFGNVSYVLFVLAETEGLAKAKVYEYPKYKRDEDAKIVSIEQIDMIESKVL